MILDASSVCSPWPAAWLCDRQAPQARAFRAASAPPRIDNTPWAPDATATQPFRQATPPGLGAQTLVRTMRGDIAVAHVVAGDRVLGKDCRLHTVRATPAVTLSGRGAHAPIHIPAGTLGNPHDMLLSPHQTLRIADWRVALILGCDDQAAVLARDLTILAGVEVRQTETITFHQLFLDQPQSFSAGGLWCDTPVARWTGVFGRVAGAKG